jgi:GH35 family endo-1,4-beta-xylanase
MRFLKLYATVFCLWLILVFLSGCQQKEEEIADTFIPTSTTAPPATFTVEPTSEATHTSTVTPSHSPTPNPTNTSSPPELTDEILTEVIEPYAAAMELDPNIVLKEIKEDPMAELNLIGKDGIDYLLVVHNPATVRNIEYVDLYESVPLLIRNQSDANWRAVTLRDLGNITGIEIANTYYWGGKRQEHYLAQYEYGAMWAPWLKSWPEEDKAIDFSYLLQQDIPFSKNNNISVFAFGPIWPQEVPDWVKQIKDPVKLENVLVEYTRNLAEFSKEKGIESIVLLNEKDHYNHPDVFKNVLGNDYDSVIFNTFNEIYPEAQLIFNEFDNYHSGLRRFNHTIDTASKLKDSGLDAIGVQFLIPVDDVEKTAAGIKEISEKTGLPVYATEVQVNIFDDNSSKRLLNQARQYKDKMEAMLKGGIKGIVFWGITDEVNYFELLAGKRSWAGFSKDADAMFFNDNLQPKPAYYAVLQALYQHAISQ